MSTWLKKVISGLAGATVGVCLQQRAATLGPEAGPARGARTLQGGQPWVPARWETGSRDSPIRSGAREVRTALPHVCASARPRVQSLRGHRRGRPSRPGGRVGAGAQEPPRTGQTGRHAWRRGRSATVQKLQTIPTLPRVHLGPAPAQ